MKIRSGYTAIIVLCIFIGSLIVGLLFGYLTAIYNTELTTVSVAIVLLIRLAIDIYSIRKKNGS